MSEEILSQDEINALLGLSQEDSNESDVSTVLTEEEKDAIGEIGNISMGTSATTLFTLLNQKVSITTPRVKVWEWQEFLDTYPEDIVIINVDYKEGLTGTNLLLLKEEDVKKITDIMMGGDGTNTSGELTDIHLSAIAEAMNQMVGSASTSMSQMLDMKVDIAPPKAFVTSLDTEAEEPDLSFAKDGIVQVAFSMKVGNIIDSEIMQILPIKFARQMVEQMTSHQKKDLEEQVTPITPFTAEEKEPQVDKNTVNAEVNQQQIHVEPSYNSQPQQAQMHFANQQPQMYNNNTQPRPMAQDIDVKKPQFPTFDEGYIIQQKENMDLIMDVPLEVTVELGRTKKKIKDILEFNPGTIIELDRLAGEPIDILVNGKFVAQGEVVVIDENFGIRITDIINPELRV